MKPVKLGVLSALTASVCCVGPALLALLGLGGLGAAAFIGRYHWWLIGAAITLLAFGWRNYLREGRRCRTEACTMAQGKTARAILIVASVIVATFVGLNVYTYAGQRRSALERSAALEGAALTAVAIPVKGMSCWSCELTVESSLKELPGVQHIEASVKEQTAYVTYDPQRIALDALVAAINGTGFRAESPSEAARP
jgi:copper chaperone CopZ